MGKTLLSAAIGLSVVLVSSHGFAQHAARKDQPVGGSNAPTLYSTIGASISAGGGVVGFVDADMRDFADVGGSWDVRVVGGTRTMVGVELAYTGGAMSIDALGLDTSARLVSTGLEAAARVNFLTEDWQPYAFAGIGWRRYDLTNEDFNTSSVAGSDDLLEIPVGAGISYRYRGFVADMRGTFRGAFSNDLVDSSGSDQADLHNWSAEATAGWEF